MYYFRFANNLNIFIEIFNVTIELTEGTGGE